MEGEEERISRLLCSVEREEGEELVERPCGSFVRELFVDDNVEEPVFDDEEDGDQRDEDGESQVEEADDQVDNGMLLPGIVNVQNSDFEDIQNLPLYIRCNENIVRRINGKLAYMSKRRDFLWDVHPVSAQHGRTSNRNIIRMRMGCVSRQAKNASTPLEVWKLFFSDEMIHEITTCTNVWIEENQYKFSRERDANTTTEPEIRAVIGVLYMVGVMRCSHTILEDLWATDGFGVEFFRCAMSLKRFKFLLRAMRFDDIRSRQERTLVDKMAPIRDLYEEFVENCQGNYIVSEFVTIDEMLESFRGRCSFRQFIKNKPAKYGIKVYAMVCAKTFYTANLEVYLGKQVDGPFVEGNSAKEVVCRLIEPITGTGRNVTVDNFFCSVPLCNELLENHRLTLVGTLRQNKREIPCEFLDHKSKPLGSSCFAFKDKMVIVSYKAKKNKNIMLLSSMHDDAAVDMDEESRNFGKPEIVLFYNSSKGGVDTVDQYKETYSTKRVSNRWSMRLFYSILDIGGVNSFVVLKKNLGMPQMKRRMFLKELAVGLSKEYCESRLLVRNIPKQIKQRICDIMKIDRPGDQRIPPSDDVVSGRCYSCTWKQNRLSKTRCSTCRFFICREHTAPAKCSNCVLNENPEVEMEVDSEDSL
uniref:PiggyBac transposable element-derived protein domain-containing protein n=1 Tax=Graphocephala atropunctata TaxID=36148 RepID=A0A1B6LVC4_9HEMI